ncbi:helix-turn-helix domain-containing protein [Amycolatopsis kentuckyensis]|uniref:helix-turn-helix domain-containing protein n=1 Tax=Amycolatopsis kentuckyensis TaxID=218823 RepID=UPI000A36D724|nr:helix-turn-helix domain-containing protein [Amycolatopsis kentuckyensis]
MSRGDDILALVRLSTEPGAVRTMLDWLAGRTGGTVALLDVDGRAVAAPSAGRRPRPPFLEAATAAVADMHRRGTPSAVLDGRSGIIDLVCLDTVRAPVAAGDAAPYLVVVGRRDRRDGALLADASHLLGLCWRLERAEHHRERVDLAMAHSREAALHLLMIGSVAAAQRIATTLGPRLPELLRVYLVECPPHRRRQVAEQIDRFAPSRAWIVPCPVRAGHLIALVPSAGDHPAPGSPAQLDHLITERIHESRLGVSEEVPLRDTANGYEQAFHALAVARGVPGRYACFDRHTDLTPFDDPRGHAWAAGFLAPCLSYTPARRADPGAEELLATLNSWLTFDSGASRHLKIHRNTLAARIHLLDELLGLDLTSVADQTAAWLALRLHSARHGQATPPEAARTPSLDELLAAPATRAWARTRLDLLEQAGRRAGFDTVRAWLCADTRISATAAALGISAPAARKRLTKIEQALGRSLLHTPSAKHELWLAMRAHGAV